MPRHALIVNERTIDFITQVNGGQRPGEETLRTKTWFLHSDQISDYEPNEMLDDETFKKTYEFVAYDTDNSNIVVRK